MGTHCGQLAGKNIGHWAIFICTLLICILFGITEEYLDWKPGIAADLLGGEL